MRTVIPLKERKIDYIFLIFLFINLFIITYIIDIEQIIIVDTSNFDYPFWPPRFFVDLIHWWGNTFDPALMARPAWWRATIWIDVLYFGPFYAAAIYAFIKGKDWIRLPAIIWSAMMFTNVFIILSEELHGDFATPERLMVILANAAWFLFPIFMTIRMWKSPYPFTRPSESSAA